MPNQQGVTLEVNPLPKQWEALKLLLDDYPESLGVEEVLFGGGGGGGKSLLGAIWLLMLAIRYPGIRLFVARRELKDLHQTTWPSISEAVTLMGVPKGLVEFKSADSQIIVRQSSKSEPSVISLVACKWEPSDPHYDRFGSYQYTSGWFEEAQEMPEKGIDVLGTRVGRWKNDEYGIRPRRLYTANPSKNWLYRVFYKPWREGSLPKTLRFVQSLHGDNKYLSSYYRSTLDNIRDAVTRQRIRDGIWEFAEDGQLIAYDALLDLFTNDVDEGGVRAMTADVARFGGDRIVIFVWTGATARLIRTFSKKDLNYTAGEIRTLMALHRIPVHNVVIDEDGIGGGIVDMIPGSHGFTANHAPPAPTSPNDSRENYSSLKSMCGYRFSDDVNARLVRVEIAADAASDLDPDKGKLREMIIADLEQLRRWNADKDGKLMTMPKDEIKKNLGRSPDFLDALVMRKGLDAPYYRPVQPQSRSAQAVKAQFDRFAAI